MRLLKYLRARLVMAKNAAKGKKRGSTKSKSPYQKYQKTPYVYSAAYQQWRRSILNRKPTTSSNWKIDNRGKAKEIKIAAE